MLFFVLMNHLYCPLLRIFQVFLLAIVFSQGLLASGEKVCKLNLLWGHYNDVDTTSIYYNKNQNELDQSYNIVLGCNVNFGNHYGQITPLKQEIYGEYCVQSNILPLVLEQSGRNGYFNDVNSNAGLNPYPQFYTRLMDYYDSFKKMELEKSNNYDVNEVLMAKNSYTGFLNLLQYHWIQLVLKSKSIIKNKKCEQAEITFKCRYNYRAEHKEDNRQHKYNLTQAQKIYDKRLTYAKLNLNKNPAMGSPLYDLILQTKAAFPYKEQKSIFDRFFNDDYRPEMIENCLENVKRRVYSHRFHRYGLKKSAKASYPEKCEEKLIVDSHSQVSDQCLSFIHHLYQRSTKE
jgi:hypothetical protein